MHGPIEIPTTDQVTVTGLSKPAMIGLGVGIAGLAATAALGASAGDEMRHFGHSMLVAIVFFLSISLGALFFTLLQHVTSAGWSVVVRRVAEAMTAAFPILGLLVLLVLVGPVLAGKPWIYDWADHKFVEAHELIQHKAGYLNAKFFLIRVIAYFAVWIGVARFFSGQSLAQDVDQDKSRTLKMQGRSGICMIAFGLTLTFAMFDFSAREDVRLVGDVRTESDAVHPGKVCLRAWYERNKHIFPASRWENYEPGVDHGERYTVKG